MDTKIRILVIDDDASIGAVLNRALVQNGFEVVVATNGIDGLSRLAEYKPHLLILDLHLPDTQGDALCRSIRQNPKTRDVLILMITGKKMDGVQARCLNDGSDAYLAKPFGLADLLAQVHALLRRPAHVVMDNVVSRGRLMIRLEERGVFWGGTRIPDLSPKEFNILKELVSQSPHVVDKSVLAEEAWGVPLEQLHLRTIDVHVRRLRQKLGPVAAESLKTVPSIGFQWLEETSSIGRKT